MEQVGVIAWCGCTHVDGKRTSVCRAHGPQPAHVVTECALISASICPYTPTQILFGDELPARVMRGSCACTYQVGTKHYVIMTQCVKHAEAYPLAEWRYFPTALCVDCFHLLQLMESDGRQTVPIDDPWIKRGVALCSRHVHG